MITDAAYRVVRLTAIGRAGIAARDFTSAPGGGTAWNFGGAVVGVIGPDKIVNAIIRYSAKLAVQASGLDASAANEMVALMQERVPRRTGLLSDGIEAFAMDGAWTVQAHAQLYGNTADYARMVEFGTKPGNRGRRVASDDYFAGPYSGRRGSINDATGRRRRSADARRLARRDHPGTEPQPYFVPSVREVLARRGEEMAALSDRVAADEDLA